MLLLRLHEYMDFKSIQTLNTFTLKNIPDLNVAVLGSLEVKFIELFGLNALDVETSEYVQHATIGDIKQ